MVKRYILAIAMIGIFITNCMISASSIKQDERYEIILERQANKSELNTISYYESNTADFGYVGSLNRDKSYGNAIVSNETLVEANWITAGENVNGYFTMTLANFIQNADCDTLDNYRLSNYKIIIHDGPNLNDPIIFAEERPIIENKEDLIEELEFPIDFETKGQSSREFAVERIAETTMISNRFNIPIKATTNEDRQTTIFHVTFDNQEDVTNNIDSEELLCSESASSNIDIYLGEILIWWDMDYNMIRISKNKMPTDPINKFVNYSEDVTINAYIELTIDLPFSPKVHPILPLGCKAHLSIDGGIHFKGGTKQTVGVYLDPVPLTEENLHKTFTLPCNITVNTENHEFLFLPSLSLSYHPINVWDFSPSWDSIEWEYIIIEFRYD